MDLAGWLDCEPIGCHLDREGRRHRGTGRRCHEVHPRRRRRTAGDGRSAGDGDGDRVAILVAVEGDVCAVGELEMQDMHARVECERGGELAFAVVEVLRIGEDDLAGWGEVGVDEDVHVACTLVDLAGRLDYEPAGRHLDREGRCHRGTGRRCHEVHPRRRRRTAGDRA